VKILGRPDLVDEPTSWPVVKSQVLANGSITEYLRDEVQAPDGHRMLREYLRHPGAVGIIALDDQERVALVRQYRHPVQHRLIEPPAGLLDVSGEGYLQAAQRELAEEVGLAGGTWNLLVDYCTSPGMLSETLRVYLARDLESVSIPEDYNASGEEAHMDVVWAPLAEVVDAILAGQLNNPTLVTGILATEVARRRSNFAGLRPPDAPWLLRDQLLGHQAP
jgi:8-oxo-dGDP phosphatase